MPKRLPPGTLVFCPRCRHVLYAFVLATQELVAACTACHETFSPHRPEADPPLTTAAQLDLTL